MAEMSTVARPYAQALFAVACDSRVDFEQWARLVAQMAEIVNNPEGRALMLDPRFEATQRVQTFVELLSEPLPPALYNFVVLLVQNHRLLALPDIVLQFEALKNQYYKITPVTITTAFALNEAQLKDLVTALERKFGLALKPCVIVDPSLIGGVRVTVGDQVVDASVQAQLTHMQDILAA